MNEGKKDRRDPIRTIKPKNPVAKNANAAIGGGAAGAHKDKKKAMKQGEVKHKKAEYAEHLTLSLRKAMTENAQQYNKFRVGQKATYKNSQGQEFPVIVTAVEFDDDAVEIRSADNKPFPNSGGDLTIVVDPGWKFLTPAMRVDPNSVVPASARESFDSPEYNDEAGMATSNLLTLARAVKGLHDTIGKDDNLPEWCQEKIAKAEMMLVSVWDYMLSQKAQGIDPKVDESRYDRRDAYQRDYDSSVSGMGKRQSYAYQQDGGANDEYNTPEYDPEFQRNRQETMMYNVTVDGKPVTPKPLLGRSAAIAWAKEQIAAGKLDPKDAKLSPVKYDQGVAEDKGPCWKDYKQIGMKNKGGKKVPNCVPKEGWTHDSLAAQLFETENTYEDKLSNLLNKRLGK